MIDRSGLHCSKCSDHLLPKNIRRPKISKKNGGTLCNACARNEKMELKRRKRNWNWSQKRKDKNNKRSENIIISNNALDSITLAAITAAMTMFTGTGIATIDLRLKVDAQPAISLRRLLSLKHNQTHEGKF